MAMNVFGCVMQWYPLVSKGYNRTETRHLKVMRNANSAKSRCKTTANTLVLCMQTIFFCSFSHNVRFAISKAEQSKWLKKFSRREIANSMLRVAIFLKIHLHNSKIFSHTFISFLIPCDMYDVNRSHGCKVEKLQYSMRYSQWSTSRI